MAISLQLSLKGNALCVLSRVRRLDCTSAIHRQELEMSNEKTAYRAEESPLVRMEKALQ